MSRFRLRLKILLKDRTACICYGISVIVMLCLLIGLNSASEEKSAVPIGLVVEDESREAEYLRERIKDTISRIMIQKVLTPVPTTKSKKLQTTRATTPTDRMIFISLCCILSSSRTRYLASFFTFSKACPLA